MVCQYWDKHALPPLMKNLIFITLISYLKCLIYLFYFLRESQRNITQFLIIFFIAEADNLLLGFICYCRLWTVYEILNILLLLLLLARMILELHKILIDELTSWLRRLLLDLLFLWLCLIFILKCICLVYFYEELQL